MTALFLALVGVAGAVVAFLLLRKRQKEKAPEATWWVGPIGFVSAFAIPAAALPRSARFGCWSSEVLSIVADMEAFLGKKIAPVVVVFVEGFLELDGILRSAGTYHPLSRWTHPWIEVSVGSGEWWPRTLRETAFEHELLHHATGLGDTKAFYELLAKYEKTRSL